MRAALKVRKKGVIIPPKRLGEEAGIGEGDDAIVEVEGNRLVLRPLKPRVVDVDPALLEELLGEKLKGGGTGDYSTAERA